MPLRMKNAHTSYPAKFGYFMACIVAAGFYCILFLLFKFEIKVKAHETKNHRRFAEITMLPIEQNPKYRWQKNMIASLEILDPTIMSLPNASYGFSRVRNLEFERPNVDLPPFEFELVTFTIPTLNPTKLSKPIGDLIDEINVRDLKTISCPSELEKEDSVRKLKSLVYWTDDYGNIYHDFPKISLDQATQTIQNTATIGPTRLRVSFRKKLVRVRMISSSGNSELDQLAIQKLRSFYLGKSSREHQGLERLDEEAEEGLIINAFWRFLDKIHESDDLTKEETWNDWDRL